MARCATIKANGQRCGAQAMTGYDQCYVHAPEMAEKRKKTNSKGGKRGGRGRSGPAEIHEVRGQIRTVIAGVLNGQIPRGTGAVLFQGFGVLLKAIEIERKIKETEELEATLLDIETRLADHERGARRWR